MNRRLYEITNTEDQLNHQTLLTLQYIKDRQGGISTFYTQGNKKQFRLDINTTQHNKWHEMSYNK